MIRTESSAGAAAAQRVSPFTLEGVRRSRAAGRAAAAVAVATGALSLLDVRGPVLPKLAVVHGEQARK